MDYRKEVSGVNAPTQQVTQYAKQKSAGSQLLETGGTALVNSAIQGYVGQHQQNAVDEVLGRNLSTEEVTTKVEGVAGAQGAFDTDKMTREQYEAAGAEMVNTLGADARTLNELSKQGKVSSIYAEAWTRGQVSRIASNPFYAAFLGGATGAAGPLAGGNPDLAARLSSDPAYAETLVRAEAQKKAQGEYEQAVTLAAMKTGLDRTEVESRIRSSTRNDMRIAELQQQDQLDARDMRTLQSALHKKSITSFQDRMVELIDPQSKTLSVQGKQDMTMWLQSEKNRRMDLIATSSLSEDDQKKQLELLDKTFAGMEAQLENADTVPYLENLQKATDSRTTLLGTVLDPVIAYYNKNGTEAEKAHVAQMLKKERVEYFKSQYGEDNYEALMEQVGWEAENIYNSGALKGLDNPLMPHMAFGGSDPTAPTKDENGEIKEDTLDKLGQIFNANPADSFLAIQQGGLTGMAQRGDSAARKIIQRTTNIAQHRIQSLIGGFAAASGGKDFGKIGFQRVQAGRGGTKLELQIPTHVSEADQKMLVQTYQQLAKSPWVWQNKFETPQAAFMAFVDGEPMDFSGEATPQGRTGQMKKNNGPTPAQQENASPAASQSPTGALYGQDAVDAVTAREGELSPIEKLIVEEEGYSASEYADTKGISTTGVGQTGEFQGKSFKQTAQVITRRAKKAIPELDKFPDEVKGPIIASFYRGGLSGSPEALKLINEGNYSEAALEFLDNDEYLSADTPPAIKARMERVADAIRKMGG